MYLIKLFITGKLLVWMIKYFSQPSPQFTKGTLSLIRVKFFPNQINSPVEIKTVFMFVLMEIGWVFSSILVWFDWPNDCVPSFNVPESAIYYQQIARGLIGGELSRQRVIDWINLFYIHS